MGVDIGAGKGLSNLDLRGITGPDGGIATELNAELTHICRTVAGDYSVTVRIGPEGGGSYADLEKRSITLDPETIRSGNGRFVAAHEGAHISDTATYEQLAVSPKELAKKIGLLALRNVVEDGAINDRFVRDLPSLKADTLAAYPTGATEVGFIDHPEVVDFIKKLGFVPRYAVALAALLQDWSELRHQVGFRHDYPGEPYKGAPIEDPHVEEFVRRNLPDFRQAVSLIYQPGASGREMFAAAKDRHMWCEKVLYPELEKLVRLDLKQIARDLSEAAANQEFEKLSKAERERQARELLAGFDDAVRQSLESLFDKNDPAPKAADVIREENQQAREAEAVAAAQADFAEGGRRLRDALMRNLSPYQRYYYDVVDRVEEIESRLKDAFVPNMHFKWEGGHASGPKVDMTQAMRFELTGQGADNLFQRRIDPTRPDIGIVVLVDRSGSMAGQKIEYAVRASVFSKEIFQRLGVKCAIVGFHDYAEILAPFEADTQDSAVQDKIMQGLCLQGSTQDAQAVGFSLKLLEAEGIRRGAIVVVSDADSSEGDELKKMVRTVEDVGVPVIHFGIGNGTVDEGGNYTRSFGGLSVTAVRGGENNFFDVFAKEMVNLATELF